MNSSDQSKDADKTATLDDIEQNDEARDSHTDSWRMRSEGEEGEHADELVGEVVAGRYRIKGLLGRGGMGAVYHAEHTELHKQVALKVLHRYMCTNEEVVARFEREAVAAGRLAHPSIVAATDFGRIEDGSFYLALEFIDGRSLADLLAEEGRLEPRRAVSIAYQMNDALCAAHEAGIVHRDLKPENVLLVRMEDGTDFVKVVDFGIAKLSLDEDHQEGLTRAGLVFGTPEYMSPEQAMGHPADSRSDLYGVGMMLYEMCAGSSPFFAEEVTEMLAKQIKEPPPELPESVPEKLRELVYWLLEKDPEARPESALALADELAVLAKSLDFSLPPPRTSAGTRLDANRKPSTRQNSSPGSAGSKRSPSARPSRSARKRIPLWVSVAALAVGVALGVGAMLMNREAVPTKEMRERAELIDAEAQLISEASAGDRDAIAELRKLTILKQRELEESGAVSKGESTSDGKKSVGAKTPPVAQPSEAVSAQANRYFVLGRGYSAIRHYSAAIEMYREAVSLDPHLSEEAELLLDVRVAIAARDAVDDGLDFALKALGSHGADIIYDVYLDHLGQAGMTPVVARAMKIAQSDQLMANATPALRVALRLQQAKLCGEYREVIPDAVQFADDRSLPTLRALQSERGCGTDGKKDCFICLRKKEIDLAGAVAHAEANSSPSFLTPTEQATERAK